jgi:hypothetical protein
MTRSNHIRMLLGASVAALLALLLTVSVTQKPRQPSLERTVNACIVTKQTAMRLARSSL